MRAIDWRAMEAVEIRLLRKMSVAESLRDFIALQTEFEPWLRKTEPLYRGERARDVARLQDRLRRIDQHRGNPVNRLIQSVLDLQKRLDSSGIPTILIGGLAVGVWGKPRLTRDIDFKALSSRADASNLVKALGRGYKPLHPDPAEALRMHTFAFFLDRRGTRVDLLLADNDFDVSAISRGVEVELAPRRKGRVATAEDLIVYKMISDRPVDHADAESIIRRQGEKLDDAHVEKWLREFEAALAASNLVSEYRRLRQS